MALVAEVIGHLDLQPALEHAGLRVRGQPAVTGQPHPRPRARATGAAAHASIDAGSPPVGTRDAAVSGSPSFDRFLMNMILSAPAPSDGRDTQITPLTQVPDGPSSSFRYRTRGSRSPGRATKCGRANPTGWCSGWSANSSESRSRWRRHAPKQRRRRPKPTEHQAASASPGLVTPERGMGFRTDFSVGERPHDRCAGSRALPEWRDDHPVPS